MSLASWILGDEKQAQGQCPWFGASTVDALVSRGLMSYTEWRDSRKGRFPIPLLFRSHLYPQNPEGTDDERIQNG